MNDVFVLNYCIVCIFMFYFKFNFYKKCNYFKQLLILAMYITFINMYFILIVSIDIN